MSLWLSWGNVVSQHSLYQTFQQLRVYLTVTTSLEQFRTQRTTCDIPNIIPFSEVHVNIWRDPRTKGHSARTGILWQPLEKVFRKIYVLLGSCPAANTPVLTIQGCSTGCKSLIQLPLPHQVQPLQAAEKGRETEKGIFPGHVQETRELWTFLSVARQGLMGN